MSSIDVARENIEAFNAGDWERFSATFAEGAVYDEPGTQRHLVGHDAILDANRGWREAFPDARGRIERAVADDGTVTLEITWEGTQSGPLRMPTGDIPPSGRRVVVKAAEVFDVEGGKIREADHYFDLMGLLQQIAAAGQRCPRWSRSPPWDGGGRDARL
jgi:steroid delta-isomerase-like uncharacterized protein